MLVTHVCNINFGHIEINQWLREFPTSVKCHPIPTESVWLDMCQWPLMALGQQRSQPIGPNSVSFCLAVGQTHSGGAMSRQLDDRVVDRGDYTRGDTPR